MSKYFNDTYDCIIIGGSLSGLASALTLTSKGLKVLVLEQHNLPGGVATSFVRGGVEIEASLHEMMSIGSKECPLKIRKFLEENGVFVDWIRVPEAYRFVEPGVDVRVHAGDHGNFDVPAKDIADGVGDPDGVVYKKVLELLELCNRVYESVNVLSVSTKSKVEMILKHNDFVTTAGYSAREVIDKFNLPKKVVDILSAYWIYVGSPLEDLPFTIWAVLMADYLGYGSYIPLHTSHEMSLKMAESAMAKGAQVEFGVKVDKILVENGRVKGVRTASGDEIYSDYVICSAYPNYAYTKMIEPLSEVPKEAYKFVNSKDLGLTCFSVVLLLDKDYKELGLTDYSTFYSPEDFDMQKIWKSFGEKNSYNYITSICTNIAHENASPKGTCIYSITALPQVKSWDDVNVENYREKREKIAKEFIRLESERLGFNLADHILEIIYETPVTIAHYTNAYMGSIYGYRHQMDDHIVARLQMSHKENYIHGLSFAGSHQISGDGMAPAITNGRKAAKIILDYRMEDMKEAKKNER